MVGERGPCETCKLFTGAVVRTGVSAEGKLGETGGAGNAKDGKSGVCSWV